MAVPGPPSSTSLPARDAIRPRARTRASPPRNTVRRSTTTRARASGRMLLCALPARWCDDEVGARRHRGAAPPDRTRGARGHVRPARAPRHLPRAIQDRGRDALRRLDELRAVPGVARRREFRPPHRPDRRQAGLRRGDEAGPAHLCRRRERPAAPAGLRIADDSLPYGGTWTFELAPAEGGGTTLTITEDGFVEPAIFRALARFVFGYHATMEGYLAGLGRRFGETVIVERAP